VRKKRNKRKKITQAKKKQKYARASHATDASGYAQEYATIESILLFTQRKRLRLNGNRA